MIKQNPFSLYDFLGYFIPGATLFYSFLILNELRDGGFLELGDAFNHLINLNFDKVLIFIVFAYLIGHIISFLSSITIEKMCNWKYGYPSKYLLSFKPNSYFESNGENVRGTQKRWRLLVRFFLWPCWLWDKIFRLKKNYTTKLDRFAIKAIKSKLTALYSKLGLEEPSSIDRIDFHRVINHYVFEKNPGHQFKMVNYVSLYGLLRNICFVSIILFWYLLIISCYSYCSACQIDWGTIGTLLTLTMLSFVTMSGFVKFYRRYTLEGLMLLVCDTDLK